MKNLTIKKAHELLKNKEISSKEIVENYISNIEKNNLNAFITTNFENAIENAIASDNNIANNSPRGYLEGIPIAHKDLFCTKGLRTTAASKMLDDFVPEYESFVGQKLIDAGSICIGKTNLDEFGMGSGNENSFYGPCFNPYKEEGSSDNFVPGGSSGGSAVAVASDLCVAATGTDTGGSIRQPASFTGTVGLKPTYGRCSRWGIIAYASSLDQPGPMTKTVEDSAIMLNHMAGYDKLDSTSADIPIEDYTKYIGNDIKGKKIGIVKQHMESMSSDNAIAFDKIIDIAKQSGAEIVEVDLQTLDKSLSAYYIIATAEASSNLARYDGVRYGFRAEEYTNLDDMYNKTRSQGFGEEVKRRILTGTYVLSAGFYDAYYLKAQKVRKIISDEFKQAFESCDVILSPIALSSAFKVGEKPSNPSEVYLNDIYTVPVNLAGLPSISIPVTMNDKQMPIGLQFIGSKFKEGDIISVADFMEKKLGFVIG